MPSRSPCGEGSLIHDQGKLPMWALIKVLPRRPRGDNLSPNESVECCYACLPLAIHSSVLLMVSL